MQQKNLRGEGADTQTGGLVCFSFDGEEVRACKGQTIAAALLATGRRQWRYTSRCGQPRGLFCGIGLCFDCLVQVDGRPNVRACQKLVADGLRVQMQRGHGWWEVPA